MFAVTDSGIRPSTVQMIAGDCSINSQHTEFMPGSYGYFCPLQVGTPFSTPLRGINAAKQISTSALDEDTGEKQLI